MSCVCRIVTMLENPCTPSYSLILCACAPVAVGTGEQVALILLLVIGTAHHFRLRESGQFTSCHSVQKPPHKYGPAEL